MARGHEVHVFAQGGGMAARMRKAGIHVHTVAPSPLNRLNLLWNFRGGFDVIHACNSTAGDDVLWALRKAKLDIPWVMSVHGVLPPSVTSAAQNPSFAAARELITFDQTALQRLEALPDLNRRVCHVPRPVEKREVPGNGANKRDLVMISRLSKTKGKGALAAIDAVERLNNFDGKLTIVGDGSLLPKIQKRAAQINADKGKTLVEAVGAQTDPFPIMANAAGVIGTAYVALEALFHEIPVVAAGYEGYGAVTAANLRDAVDCNFGDSLPGKHVEITADLLSDGLSSVLGHFQTSEGKAELQSMREDLEKVHSIQNVAEQLEAVYACAQP
jgi:glycosyltransferase involved in cell wall biosynthesis